MTRDPYKVWYVRYGATMHYSAPDLDSAVAFARAYGTTGEITLRYIETPEGQRLIMPVEDWSIRR